MNAAAPRRELGLVHGVGVVVGAIIGVGIFLTPSKVAATAGSPAAAMGLWALGGAIALCGSLSLAEVGARFPDSGGQLLALRRLLGKLPAFLYGWCLLLAIQTGVLVLITLFAARNLAVVLGASWGRGGEAAAATAILLSLAAANLAGVRQGAWVQTTTSAAKLLILAALAGLGLAAAAGFLAADGAAAPAATRDDAAAPWIAGLAATLFAYGGFHQLTWVGGEVRAAERTVPRAIVLGTAIVLAAYLAVNLAYFALLSFAGVAASQTLAADAVGSVWPGAARTATAAALCVSAYGVANTSLLTAPRVYYSLARDGLFFRPFARLDPSAGVPRVAILLQTALALALLWLVGPRMEHLVNGVVFVDWTFHALTCAGLITVSLRAGDAHAGYRSPLGPVLPALFIAGTAAALVATFLDPAVRASSVAGVAVVGAGALAYPFVARMAP